MVEKQSGKTLKTVFFLMTKLVMSLLIIYCFLQLFLYSYNFAYQVFANSAYEASNEKYVTVTIHKGASIQEIAKVLEQERVVANRYVLATRYYLSKYHGQIKEGTYQISPSMPMDDILATISSEQVKEDKGTNE